MIQRNSHRPTASTPDYDYFRRLYAHAWQPGLDRVRVVTRMLAERGIRFEVDGFMADRTDWATGRPDSRHEPDIRVLAS
jgi:hypothetical protein